MQRPGHYLIAAVPLILALAATEFSRAADPAKGARLARQWCASCHIVAPGMGGSDAAPPFAAVAKRPGFTAADTRAWLADPHPPMPNLNLSRAEIDAIVTYIESLRID